MHRLIPVIVLLSTYLALTPKLGVSHLFVGLGIALGILWLLRPMRRSVSWEQLPSAIAAVCLFVVITLRNVIISGIQVVRIVMHPALPIKTGIIAFPPECDSEIGRALAAHAISLAPGELLIEMDDDGTMYIHSLDVSTSERMVRGAQKQRRALFDKMFD